MKPALLVMTSALCSSYFATFPPAAPRERAARTAAAEATGLSRLVWLAKADAAADLRKTRFSFSHEGGGVRVLADPVLLRGGLARLMSQSARSMDGNARMRLKLASSPGRVTLELRDGGPGLSVRDLAAMYGSGDSGLGEVRSRIERAGGVIHVSSESGAGTAYLIELPAAPLLTARAR